MKNRQIEMEKNLEETEYAFIIEIKAQLTRR